MSETTKFLVAKYVPDLQRMEPKNIGVVLASSDIIGARFYGENEGQLRAPEFIHKRNKSVYVEWVQYWNQQINKVNASGPKELDRGIAALNYLQGKSKGSYVLVDGGMLLAKLALQDFGDALDDLFNQFVGELPPKVQLKQLCDKVIRRSLGEGVKNNYSVPLKVANINHDFKFHYAMPNGKNPHALFHRVSLNNESSVNSATLMFRSACESGIAPEQCGALVSLTSEDKNDSTAMLESFGRIVDVSNTRSAMKLISKISTYSS